MPLPVIIIIVYLVITTGAAALLMRRTRDADSWSVASSGMGLWLVVAGVAGTRIGGVGTYGVAGDVARSGVWNLWYAVNTLLALALVGLFFVIPYRRLKLHTVSEIFQVRYGSRRCQILTSLCVQTEYLVINILEPFVIGSILSTILDISFGLGVAIGAFILILSAALGGLWGSSLANLMHCAMVIFGLLAVCLLGSQQIGGWSAMTEQINGALAVAEVDRVSWWSFVGAGWGAVFAMFFSATVHTPAASVYVNYATSARREKILVPAFLIAGLVAALMPLLAGWIGMQTVAVYGVESGLAGYRAITQLAVDISPLVGGLALAAVLAAVISSGAPILLASSTLLLKDWVPPFSRLSSRGRLLALRAVTVVYGSLAAVIAWQWRDIGSILDLLLLGFAMVVPPAVAVGFLLYWRRTSERGCFFGTVAGYLGGLAWYGLGHLLLADPTLQEGAGPIRALARGFANEVWWHDPSYLTMLVPLLLVPSLSLLMPEPAEDREARDSFYRRVTTPIT
jgi:SSS family solute:Na+ symporter